MRNLTISVTPVSVRVIRAAKKSETGKLSPNAVAIATKEAGDIIVDVWANTVGAFKASIQGGEAIRIRLAGNSYEGKVGETVNAIRATYLAPTGGIDDLVSEDESVEPELVGSDD